MNKGCPMMNSNKMNSRNRQQGAVLIVGLIMVLLMTIVGLAAIRGTGLQEMMAGNMRDRNVAFQSAEAALSAGESFVAQQDVHGMAFEENISAQGLVYDLISNDKEPIDEWDAADWAGAKEVDFDLDNVSETPRYVIEQTEISEYDIKRMLGMGATSDMPFDVRFYRISSRGVDGTGDAEAVVQSNYVKMN